jgi:uncharacterized protein YqhQ
MPDCGGEKRLQVGGQAVIEGVMMRSPAGIATAVRTKGGRIVVRTEPFVSLTGRNRFFGLPVIRGAVALIETFVVALKALAFSADEAAAREGEESGDEGAERKGGGVTWQMALSMAGAVVLGMALFFYVPLLLTELLGIENGILFNLIDGVFRLTIIFIYIWAITRWKEMQRIFEYHGAEHKAIFTFEEGVEVTPENAIRYQRLHPRCSTSFLLIVVLVSVVVFTFTGRPDSVAERFFRLTMIPLIGGLSYEILKASSRPAFRRYFGFVYWPGMMMQKLTTREPSEDQIEVAIAALNASLADNLVESRQFID